jgi:hypothetical protein
MGMYTEFHFNVELKEQTPKGVIDILKFMVGELHDGFTPELPDHKFFQCERWRFLFTMDSAYFPADTNSTLRKDSWNSYYLCVRSNLKNYGHEIQHFCAWIDEWIQEGDGTFVGFYRYEGRELPTLILKGRDDMEVK